MKTYNTLASIACCLFLSTPGFSQDSDLTVLTVRIENSVQYIYDITDPLKIGTQPGIAPPSVTNFYPLMTIADVTQVNGTSVMGMMVQRGMGLNWNPAPQPGQAIADIARAAVYDYHLDLLQNDGTPIGTIMAIGLGGGPPPPGIPQGSSSLTIVGGGVTTVPEPSPIVLLMIALPLLALGVLRHRSRRVAGLVGRTPWSAAGPLAGFLRRRTKSDEGVGRAAHVHSYRNKLSASIGLTVLTAAAFLHFGATPAIAQGDGMDGRLFVDRDGGRLGALCTNSDPCARITDALAVARAMRYGLDSAIPSLQPHQRINITVRASSTPYLGSPDPARLAANPALEALPLLLNISDLDLAGESKFTTDAYGWIQENSASDATTIKSEAPLPGALILIGLTEGASADGVTVRGFVLDANTHPSSNGGILIEADRAQRFLIRDTYQINSRYGVFAQGSSGIVEHCFMGQLGEGVLVWAGNATNWPSEVTVRNTRSIGNSLGGLVFFGSGFGGVAGLGAYKGVFQPVPFTGAVDRTVGHVIHNDLSGSTTDLTLTAGLRMALIGPGLPAGQSAGHLAMTVIGNRVNDNAHAFTIDAGFPLRSSPVDFTSSFTGWFEDNEATGSLTAKALVTFTRNDAAETLPDSMATYKYLVNSSYQVMYSSGEFDESPGPGGRVWIDNPAVDPAVPSQTLSSELILQAR
jgi:hypothetical protein